MSTIHSLTRNVNDDPVVVSHGDVLPSGRRIIGDAEVGPCDRCGEERVAPLGLVGMLCCTCQHVTGRTF